MSTPPVTALVAFGGNLGDPMTTLTRALPMLREGVGELIALSSLYETKALTLNGEEHPNYINAVAEFVTTRSPEQILRSLLQIERELGRDRSPEKRWEPRTIDLDLLFVGDAVVNIDPLTLPHPEIAKRDFVLQPLAEIVPNFVHPLLKKTMVALNEELESSGAERFVLRNFPFQG